MRHINYRIGVITNVNGQAMTDLQKMAEKHNVTFDQIKCTTIPVCGFKESELVRKICSYDVVYYRTGMKGSVLSELAQILKARGIPTVNIMNKHPFTYKKTMQALVADKYNIAQPKTFIIRNFDYESAKAVLGDTFIVKPDDGSKGSEVTLIKSADELSAFKTIKTKNKYIYQEFIEGADEYRIYTLGNKGIASYKKISGNDDFRANLHTGGKMENTETELEKKLLDFGGKIAAYFGADIAGVDILYKDGKYLFLELNWQPGWEHLDELTGSHFCKDTLQYILDKAHHESSFLNKLRHKYALH